MHKTITVALATVLIAGIAAERPAISLEAYSAQ